jgi:CRISPR system Cascade subunit CasC
MITVDIHILQTVPPSNINRDDTGSPKTAVFGGTTRARVSSQAWKRATRQAFEGRVDTADLGVRTKRVVELVAENIVARRPDLADTAQSLAETALKAAGIALTAPKTKKGDDVQAPESGYLLFLSRHQVDKLAALAIDADGGSIEKKDAKAAADSSHSVDVALFGRMVADSPDMNVDAAAQVAHALSVHAVETEFDYFTAVDDLKAGAEETGAGMIGTVEFNSSTLYRYATVNVNGLENNLGDATATVRAVQEFVRAFVTSMPTGKQNTFANRTLPEAVVVQVRDSQPINLVGAFETAVVVRPGETRVGIAAGRLAERSAAIDSAYGTTPTAAWVVRATPDAKVLDELGQAGSLDDLVAALGAQVETALAPS